MIKLYRLWFCIFLYYSSNTCVIHSRCQRNLQVIYHAAKLTDQLALCSSKCDIAEKKFTLAARCVGRAREILNFETDYFIGGWNTHIHHTLIRTPTERERAREWEREKESEGERELVRVSNKRNNCSAISCQSEGSSGYHGEGMGGEGLWVFWERNSLWGNSEWMKASFCHLLDTN